MGLPSVPCWCGCYGAGPLAGSVGNECSVFPRPSLPAAGSTGCEHRVRAWTHPTAFSQDVHSRPPPQGKKARDVRAVQGSSCPRPGRGAAVKGCWAPGPGLRTRFGLEEPSWYLTALGGWRQSARKMTLPWRTPAVRASGATKRKLLSISTWRPCSQIPPTHPTWSGLWGRKFEHYGVFRKTMFDNVGSSDYVTLQDSLRGERAML